MELLLGMILGIILMMAVFLTFAFLGKNISKEEGERVVSKSLSGENGFSIITSPKGGAILEPKDEAQETLEDLIARNDAAGIDTPIEDL